MNATLVSEYVHEEQRPADGGFSCYIEIGEHGVHRLGTVHRYDRRFFVKSLKGEYASEHLYRLMLRKEFKLLLTLSHPAVVRVYELVDIPGLGLSILMEYVGGESLEQWLAQRPSRRARSVVARELIEAVAYLHEHGVVHGDLTPGNVMVTDRGEVKLVDFGLGDGADYTLLKGVGGTRGYAAPEQWEQGYQPTARADVYALGRILQQMHLGLTFRAVARRAVRKDASRRYDSAGAMLRAIDNRRGVVRAALCLGGIAAVVAAGILLWPERGERVVAASAPTVMRDTVLMKQVDTLRLPSAPVETSAKADIGADAADAYWMGIRDDIEQKMMAYAEKEWARLDDLLEDYSPGSMDWYVVCQGSINNVSVEFSKQVSRIVNVAPRDVMNRLGYSWLAMSKFRFYEIYERMERRRDLVE